MKIQHQASNDAHDCCYRRQILEATAEKKRVRAEKAAATAAVREEFMRKSRPLIGACIGWALMTSAEIDK